MKPLFQKTVNHTDSSMGIGGYMEFTRTETYWATFGGLKASAAEVAEWTAFAAKDPVEAKRLVAAAHKAVTFSAAAEQAAAEQAEVEKAAKLLQWRMTTALKKGDSVTAGSLVGKVESVDGDMVTLRLYVGKPESEYAYPVFSRSDVLANP